MTQIVQMLSEMQSELMLYQGLLKRLEAEVEYQQNDHKFLEQGLLRMQRMLKEQPEGRERWERELACVEVRIGWQQTELKHAQDVLKWRRTDLARRRCELERLQGITGHIWLEEEIP